MSRAASEESAPFVLARARKISLWFMLAFALMLAALVVALPNVLATARAVGSAGFAYQQQANSGALNEFDQQLAFWRQVAEAFPAIRAQAPARTAEYASAALMIGIVLAIAQAVRRRPQRLKGSDGKVLPPLVLPADDDIPVRLRGKPVNPADRDAVSAGRLHLGRNTCIGLGQGPGSRLRARAAFVVQHEYCHWRTFDDFVVVVLRSLALVMNIPLLIFALYVSVFVGVWVVPAAAPLTGVLAGALAVLVLAAVQATTVLDLSAYPHFKELLADAYAQAATGSAIDRYDPALRIRDPRGLWRKAFASLFSASPVEAERRRRIRAGAGSERLPLLLAALLFRGQFLVCVLLATGSGMVAWITLAGLILGLIVAGVRLAGPLRKEWPTTIRTSTLAATLLTVAGIIALPVGQWVALVREPQEMLFFSWLLLGGATLDPALVLLCAAPLAAMALLVAVRAQAVPRWRAGRFDPDALADENMPNALRRKRPAMGLFPWLIINLHEMLAVAAGVVALSCLFAGVDALISTFVALVRDGSRPPGLVLAIDAVTLVLGIAVCAVLARRYLAFSFARPGPDGPQTPAVIGEQKSILATEGVVGLGLLLLVAYTVAVVYTAFVTQERPGDMAYAFQVFWPPDATVLAAAAVLAVPLFAVYAAVYGMRISLFRRAGI